MSLKTLGATYRSIFPASVRNIIFAARRRLILRILYSGSRYKCQVCNKGARRFKDFDTTSRSRPGGVVPPMRVGNTICPWCHSNLRHRLFWTIASQRLKESEGERQQAIRILHFAPESCLKPVLKRLEYIEYVTADLSRRDTDLNLDLTRLGLPDCEFDVVIAIHVLEHITDDVAAMSEIFRILRPGGWAALMVPILRERTYENAEITSEDERVKYFGQANHVRAYGTDFQDRLQAVGFDVKTISYRDALGNKVERNWLHDVEGTLFIASRPVS